ncbi:MAG: dolichyl-phosphate beta-glucosyltransferase [Bryobacteraceae bacterium]
MTRASDLETLSIVIPAYNEERRLPATLDRILAYAERSPVPLREILVVDDGSRDGTAALAEARGGIIRLVRNPGNRGKGYAVRQGMLAAAGDWILSTDADLSAPIEELEKLVATARRENAVVAIGSRALDRKLVKVHQPLMREISGRAFNVVMRLVTGLPFRDTQCGFKLFRRDAAREIFPRQVEDGFSFDVEDLLIAQALGLRSIEVPVEWSNVEGTKVGLMQGIKSFADLVRIRARAVRGDYK